MVCPGRDRLRGTFEVDETYWGSGEKDFVGRLTENKARIVVAAEERENGIGSNRIRHIPDLNQESLHGFITDSIEPGSTVRTDEFKSYLALIDYVHDQQVQSRQRKGECLFPRVPRVVFLLKRWLLGFHQGAIHQQHLDYYFDEFTFSFNCRTSASRDKLLWRLLQKAMQVNLATYKILRVVNMGTIN
jgi:transposase-like protein